MMVALPDAMTSARMGRVRQTGTKIETLVAKELRDSGIHYRKNVRRLPGSPDFANSSRRWAIFVNGCFWHHHTACRKATVPKSNAEFWITKFRANRQRDARAVSRLRADGYHVALVWECQVEHIRQKLAKILEAGRVDSG
jgi:DNA mismatch endonuclease Vsr